MKTVALILWVFSLQMPPYDSRIAYFKGDKAQAECEAQAKTLNATRIEDAKEYLVWFCMKQ